MSRKIAFTLGSIFLAMTLSCQQKGSQNSTNKGAPPKSTTGTSTGGENSQDAASMSEPTSTQFPYEEFTDLEHSTEPLAGLSEAKPLCGLAPGRKRPNGNKSRLPRISTFNMFGAFSTTLDSMKARIELTATALQKTDSDVIGIQEAEDMIPAGRTIELLGKRMSELTGETWYWCFFRSNPHAALEADPLIGGGGPLSMALAAIDGNTKKLGQTTWFMGDAILSRYPFASAGARRVKGRVLSEIGKCTTDQCRMWAGGESRIVVRAEIKLPAQKLHFFNSHFYTNITDDSPLSQRNQATEVVNYVNETIAQKNAPAAVACDCNSPENGTVRSTFTSGNFIDSWATTNPGLPGHTGGQDISASAKTANSRIDYVFIKGQNAKRSAIFPEAASAAPSAPNIRWPSDHLGVVVEISK